MWHVLKNGTIVRNVHSFSLTEHGRLTRTEQPHDSDENKLLSFHNARVASPSHYCCSAETRNGTVSGRMQRGLKTISRARAAGPPGTRRARSPRRHDLSGDGKTARGFGGEHCAATAFQGAMVPEALHCARKGEYKRAETVGLCVCRKRSAQQWQWPGSNSDKSHENAPWTAITRYVLPALRPWQSL